MLLVFLCTRCYAEPLRSRQASARVSPRACLTRLHVLAGCDPSQAWLELSAISATKLGRMSDLSCSLLLPDQIGFSFNSPQCIKDPVVHLFSGPGAAAIRPHAKSIQKILLQDGSGPESVSSIHSPQKPIPLLPHPAPAVSLAPLRLLSRPSPEVPRSKQRPAPCQRKKQLVRTGP